MLNISRFFLIKFSIGSNNSNEQQQQITCHEPHQRWPFTARRGRVSVGNLSSDPIKRRDKKRKSKSKCRLCCAEQIFQVPYINVFYF